MNAEQLRVHKAHLAAVPEALAAATTTIQQWPAEAQPAVFVQLPHLRTLVREVERLQAREKQLLHDMREEQREFQREARDIAAEARWQERQDHEGSG